MKREILLGLALLVGGCDFLRDPTQIEVRGSEVIVHSVLRAGSDTVAVLLQRAEPATAGNGPRIEAISGAVVRIAGGGASVPLAEAPGGFPSCVRGERTPLGEALADSIRAGCYAAVFPGGVRAGERYELRIELAGGGQIEGATVVPGAPEILAPDPGSRFEVRNQPRFDEGVGDVPVRFRVSAAVGGVEVGLDPVTAFEGGAAVPGAQCRIEHGSGIRRDGEETDTARVRIFNPIICVQQVESEGRRIELDSLHTRLLLTAYDTAYVRYLEVLGGETVARSRASAGVTGALGVFGGAATTERRITLILRR